LDVCGGLALAAVGALIVIYAWHLDMDIDAVEEGTGDALLVLGDGGRKGEEN
jgi:hypothetical protein